MPYSPGDSYVTMFTTQDANGAAVDADSLPTAVMYRNGAAVGDTVTVANVDTGLYSASGVISAGYVITDAITIVGTATVGGTTGSGVLFETKLEAAAVGSLNNVAVEITNISTC